MGDRMPWKTFFLPSTWGLLRGSFALRAPGFQSSYIQLLVWSRTSSHLHLLGPEMGMEVSVAGRVTVKSPTEEEEMRL